METYQGMALDAAYAAMELERFPNELPWLLMIAVKGDTRKGRRLVAGTLKGPLGLPVKVSAQEFMGLTLLADVSNGIFRKLLDEMEPGYQYSGIAIALGTWGKAAPNNPAARADADQILAAYKAGEDVADRLQPVPAVIWVGNAGGPQGYALMPGEGPVMVAEWGGMQDELKLLRELHERFVKAAA